MKAIARENAFLDEYTRFQELMRIIDVRLEICLDRIIAIDRDTLLEPMERTFFRSLVNNAKSDNDIVSLEKLAFEWELRLNARRYRTRSRRSKSRRSVNR